MAAAIGTMQCWLAAGLHLGGPLGGRSGAYHCDEELRVCSRGELCAATLWVRLGNPNLVTPPDGGKLDSCKKETIDSG